MPLRLLLSSDSAISTWSPNGYSALQKRMLAETVGRFVSGRQIKPVEFLLHHVKELRNEFPRAVCGRVTKNTISAEDMRDCRKRCVVVEQNGVGCFNEALSWRLIAGKSLEILRYRDS